MKKMIFKLLFSVMLCLIIASGCVPQRTNTMSSIDSSYILKLQNTIQFDFTELKRKGWKQLLFVWFEGDKIYILDGHLFKATALGKGYLPAKECASLDISTGNITMLSRGESTAVIAEMKRKIDYIDEKVVAEGDYALAAAGAILGLKVQNVRSKYKGKLESLDGSESVDYNVAILANNSQVNPIFEFINKDGERVVDEYGWVDYLTPVGGIITQPGFPGCWAENLRLSPSGKYLFRDGKLYKFGKNGGKEIALFGGCELCNSEISPDWSAFMVLRPDMNNYWRGVVDLYGFNLSAID